MRLFCAWFLAPENRTAYAGLIAAVRKDVPGAIRPVPAESHHVTLAFLGEVAERDVESCRGVLSLAGAFAPIEVTLESPRILGGRGRPRLVHVVIDRGAAQVNALQRRLHDGLRDALPGLELRPKPPHVTIARFRRDASRALGVRVAEALARHVGDGPARSDRLDRAVLVRSTLTPDGPIYEPIESVRLTADP